MHLGIAGRSAIVCASSKGLGRAAATALAEAGCKVVVNGRDAARAEATAGEIRAATGAKILVVVGDVGDPSVRAALIAACPAPDILVNNNGGPPPTPFEAVSREKLLAGLEANMLTPIALAQAIAPGMAERKFGRIVNITSAGVRAPIAGLDISAAARAGLTAFFANAARRYARDNVTINTIQPGVFATDRVAATMGSDPGKTREPQGRHSRRSLWRPQRIRRALRVSVQRPRRLCRGPEHPHRRRRLPRRLLTLTLTRL